MKIYRVPKRDTFKDGGCSDESHGYSYHTTIKSAKRAFKTNNADAEIGDEIEKFNITMTKRGLIYFLNEHCAYPDNG